MVVVIIIGLLAAILIPQVAGRTDDARIAKAKADLRALSTAIDLFKADNGYYPGNEDGLKALIQRPSGVRRWPEGGYLKGRSTAPKDPWGNDYEYFCPGGEGRPYDVFCYGSDGKPGGEGVAADIATHNLGD